MTEGFSFGRALGLAQRTFRARWIAWLAATLVLGLGLDLALEPLFRLAPEGSRPWAIALDLGYFFATNLYFTAVLTLAVSPPGTSQAAMLRRLPVAAVMVYLAEFVIHLPANLADWAQTPGEISAFSTTLALLGVVGWVANILMHALLGMASPAVIAERLGPVEALRRGWRLAGGRIWLLLVGLYLAAEIGQAIVEGMAGYFLPFGGWSRRAAGALGTAWYGLFYMLWGGLFLELRRAKDPMPAAETAQVFD